MWREKCEGKMDSMKNSAVRYREEIRLAGRGGCEKIISEYSLYSRDF